MQSIKKDHSTTDYDKYPELFAVDRQIDPRTRQRTVPMKVLNLSFPRTGTASMQAALDILGFGPTLHGFGLFMQSKYVSMWREGLEIKFQGSSKLSSPDAGTPFGRKEFDHLTGDYEVISDVPAIVFAKELVEAYPEAKIIIVERDIEAWYKSFNDTLISGIFNPITTLVCVFDGPLGSTLAMTKTYVRGWFKANSEKEFQLNARDTYRRHYELVRAITPKERLLDFDLKNGWGPLCDFLGTDVPDVLFPRINETGSFKEKQAIMTSLAGKRIMRKAIPYFAGTIVVAAGLFWHTKG